MEKNFEGKLLLNKNDKDFVFKLPFKQSQQENSQSQVMQDHTLLLNASQYALKEHQLCKRMSKQSSKSHQNNIQSPPYMRIDIQQKTKNRERNKKKKEEKCSASNLSPYSIHKSYSSCAGLISKSTCNQIAKQKQIPQLRKKIKKQEDAYKKNQDHNHTDIKDIGIPESLETSQKEDSWNFSSEEQFLPIPSLETYKIEEISDEKAQNLSKLSKEVKDKYAESLYYMENLRGYIFGSLNDIFMAQMYLSHFIQIYDNLQKSKLIQHRECEEFFGFHGNSTALNSIKSPEKQKKTLVLDLDETLVHCNESSSLKSDFFIPVKINSCTFKAGISIRPHAQEFLENMAKHFEIIIYTASNSDYANLIIDYLDPTRTLVKYRLFREHCMQIYPGCHAKDLRILQRNLKDIVLIDNSAYSFAYQIDNGIPIIPYLDNKSDDELLHLQCYLKRLLLVEDVREVNRETFHLKYMQDCKSIQQVVQHLTCNSQNF